jgi:WD40 repeat protein
MVATGQCGKIARIQIWNIDTRCTASTIASPAVQRRITALSWSRTGTHLAAVGGDDNRTAFVFCFSRRPNAAQVYKENMLGSADKGSSEGNSMQSNPNFSHPVLLFSIAMQVICVASSLYSQTLTAASYSQRMSMPCSSIISAVSKAQANSGRWATRW